MAKDIITGSKGKGRKSKQSGASFRVKHRVYSAASTERKRQAGMTRVSVWVPVTGAEALKRYAKGLCEGHEPESNSGNLAGQGWLTVITVFSAAPRKTRKRTQPDDRQLDLFGTA